MVSQVEHGEEGVRGKRMTPGVYQFKTGGRKFDGHEKLVSDSALAEKTNELFRRTDKELKKLDKKYRRIYDLH